MTYCSLTEKAIYNVGDEKIFTNNFNLSFL